MAIPSSTAADTLVAIAPVVMRHAASSVSAAPNPRTLSHISVAATAAEAAAIQASTRTLAQPGDSTSSEKNSRTTITT
jgi:hypothetical protein